MKCWCSKCSIYCFFFLKDAVLEIINTLSNKTIGMTYHALKVKLFGGLLMYNAVWVTFNKCLAQYVIHNLWNFVFIILFVN